jgi:hypothetical protein
MAEGKLVSRIGLIGSIASIAGLLGQLDIVPSLAVLATAVQIPAWTIATAIGVSMWLLPRAVGHAAGNANRHLSDQLQQVGNRARELEEANEKLKGELKTIQSSSQELANIRAHLHEVQRSLEAYESIEAEIIGLLRSGGEYDLNDLARRTSAGDTMEGRQRVLRAITRLDAKIAGGGAPLNKYRLAPNSSPAAVE